MVKKRSPLAGGPGACAAATGAIRLLLFTAVLPLASGCARTSSSPPARAGGKPAARPAAAAPRAEKGRAQLWAENCMRCHNARPSIYYSQGEWEIAMQHMRVRGYLTAAETERIMEFFRATK